MKILQISRYGKPEEVIEIVDVPEPKPPKEGEVCASVEYAPINFSELLMIRGRYGVKPPLPAALGQEGSGVILAVGGGVANVKVGDRVAIPLGKAVWRERLVLSAAGLTPLPAAADPQQLSMLRANPPTAAFLLSEYAELRPG